MIIMTVSLVNNKPLIREHFMGFLEAKESSGENLFALILKRLEELNISFSDCREQPHDNGANMKGKNKRVLARLLEINPKALFVQVGAHSLHLVVYNAAKSSEDVSGCFRILQKPYVHPALGFHTQMGCSEESCQPNGQTQGGGAECRVLK